MDLILKNAVIPQGDRKVQTNIMVDNGEIIGFTNSLNGMTADEVIDIKGNLVVPGCIDPHTHFMDPGFTHRETFATGSKSAAAGGITSHIDMPCCSKPSVRDGESFHKKLDPLKDQILGVPINDVELADDKLIFTGDESQFVTYIQIYEFLYSKHQSTRVEGHFYLPKEKKELKNSGGAPHHLYGYMTHVVMVEVDTLTGETDVLNVVAIPDVGKVLNPQGLEGQSEGGAAMGIGYTLYEDILIEDGYHKTKNFTDYIIPTIRETPVIKTVPVESNEETGPFGAKGIAEVVMIPIIPAIMSAIYDATGVRINHLPATPERIYQAIQATKKQKLVSR